MKIVDFLKKENCTASLSSTEKDGVLKELTALLVKNNEISDSDEIFNALMEREKLGSTGIGERIAIPHAKIKGLSSLVAAFGRSEAGIDYLAVDDQPVQWIFLLLASDNSTGVHLKALARISRLFKSERFKNQIEQARTDEQIYKLIEEEDTKLA
ncbi:PTS IIA-like nitrogen-regulatory protein PtsN [hydrothermal vent metagenome]|uniref:PTS IIA-like nitrogen-regulatory protein PtsN n=1 Tax=hydrothermal vent metagenome TaxID=652676 RepID=A0A3B1CEQ3_9ZZZZ